MLGLIGKRKATPVLGLDISSTTVKLLELSYSGDRYRVESYAVSSLPQDAVIEKNVNDVDGVANAVRSVVATSRTKLKSVAAAVAGSSVITKIIDMPDGLADDDDYSRAHQMEHPQASRQPTARARSEAKLTGALDAQD